MIEVGHFKLKNNGKFYINIAVVHVLISLTAAHHIIDVFTLNMIVSLNSSQ